MAQVQTRTPQVGEQAPDFTLKDTQLEPVSLHDLQGKTTILAFFPAAFSSTCTAELCSFRDSLSRLEAANAQVLGISVDLPYALREFKRAQNLSFPLLSDFDHQVIDEYGVVDGNFKGFTGGVAKRAVFVIDPSGRIAWEWVADEPGQEPDYAAVLQEADRLGEQ